MKFSLRSLFVFTAIAAALFWGCLNWPATGYPGGPIAEAKMLQRIQALYSPYGQVVSVPTPRSPLFEEVLWRAGYCLVCLVMAWVAMMFPVAHWKRKISAPPNRPPVG